MIKPARHFLNPSFLTRIADLEPETDPLKIAPHIKRIAKQQLYACHGKAMDTFAPYWRETSARHVAETFIFVYRESTLTGRILNASAAPPTPGIRHAVTHFISLAASRDSRKQALDRRHNQERTALRQRQTAFEENISRPYREILAMTDLELTMAYNNPAPIIAPANNGHAFQRQKALLEISRDLRVSRPPRPKLSANKPQNSDEIEHEQEQ